MNSLCNLPEVLAIAGINATEVGGSARYFPTSITIIIVSAVFQNFFSGNETPVSEMGEYASVM